MSVLTYEVWQIGIIYAHIFLFSTHENNLSGICGITKKQLSALTGQRLVAIQEAVINLKKLDIIVCYDLIHKVAEIMQQQKRMK